MEAPILYGTAPICHPGLVGGTTTAALLLRLYLASLADEVSINVVRGVYVELSHKSGGQ